MNVMWTKLSLGHRHPRAANYMSQQENVVFMEFSLAANREIWYTNIFKPIYI